MRKRLVARQQLKPWAAQLAGDRQGSARWTCSQTALTSSAIGCASASRPCRLLDLLENCLELLRTHRPPELKTPGPVAQAGLQTRPGHRWRPGLLDRFPLLFPENAASRSQMLIEKSDDPALKLFRQNLAHLGVAGLRHVPHLLWAAGRQRTGRRNRGGTDPDRRG